MKTFFSILSKTICLAATAWVSACSAVPDKPAKITACSPMPVKRVSAMGVAYDGKGYILGGRDEHNVVHNSIYCYDAQADSWSYMGQMPMKARVNGAAVVVDGTVYAGLGFSGGHIYRDSVYLNDWWKWDLTSGKWDSLARYPDKNTVHPIVWAEENKIYCADGFSDEFRSNLYCYDITLNTWQSIPRTGKTEAKRTASCSAAVQNTCYFGGGYDSHTLKDWIQIHPDGSIAYLADMPDRGRCMAAAAATGNTIVVVGGRYFAGPQTGGEVMKSVLTYDIVSNQWSKAGETLDAGESRTAITIHGVVYAGLGNNDEQTALNTWYKIEP